MERLTDKITNIETGKILAYRLKREVDRIKAMQKLGEYEDAEEQGLLLRLPCSIGTTVYAVVSECEGDYYECHHTCDTCDWNNTHIQEVKFDIDYIDDVGKWVFLTKEEAEQALKQMGE